MEIQLLSQYYLFQVVGYNAQYILYQGSLILLMEGRCPPEFRFNSNQTYLKHLIKNKLGTAEMCRDRLELNSGHWPSRNKFGCPID